MAVDNCLPGTSSPANHPGLSAAYEIVFTRELPPSLTLSLEPEHTGSDESLGEHALRPIRAATHGLDPAC